MLIHPGRPIRGKPMQAAGVESYDLRAAASACKALGTHLKLRKTFQGDRRWVKTVLGSHFGW